MAVDTLPPRSSTPAPEPEPSRGSTSPGWLDRLIGWRPSRWSIGGLLLVLMLASLVLRTRQIHLYYWIDEAISVGISSHPLAQLPHLLREDGSPPLYYLILHGWMQLFGKGEVATHSLSVLFALVTIPVSYFAGKSLYGRRVGAYAAVLVAGVPFLNQYAQETRMYAMLLLFSVLVAVSFIQLFVYRRRRFLPLFSLSMVASLYTHNWALFLGLATFIGYLYCLWATPKPRRAVFRDGVLGFGLVALLYLPWVPTLLYQAQHTGAPWANKPVLWSLTQGFYFITGERSAAVLLLVGAGAGLLAGTALWNTRSARSAPATGAEQPLNRQDREAMMALALLGFGTLLIAWVYAKTTPAWSGRYLAVIIGPLLLLVSLGLARARGLGLVCLALVCCFWATDPRGTQLNGKSNVGGVAHVMNRHTSADTLVLSTQPEQVPDLAYYMPQITHFMTPLGRFPDPRVMDWVNALEKFKRSTVRTVLAPAISALRPGQRVLLVIPGGFSRSPLWLKLIRNNSVRWEHYLKHDKHLKLLDDISPHEFSSGLPVRALLFVVKRR